MDYEFNEKDLLGIEQSEREHKRRKVDGCCGRASTCVLASCCGSLFDGFSHCSALVLLLLSHADQQLQLVTTSSRLLNSEPSGTAASCVVLNTRGEYK